MKLVFLCMAAAVITLLCGGSCKKHKDDPCKGLTPPGARFAFKETLSDTAFYTDTAYWDNAVNFTAQDNYSSVSWKIGTDPREFTSAGFSLPFYLFTGTIDIKFTGRRAANPECFPGDSGVYTATKKLTLVEQFDRSTLTLSPLIGRYRGAFTNTPADTFTVRIEYFDSAKYNTSLTGTKNFYWVSNYPKGHFNMTDAGNFYPELRNGQPVEMGYKCAQFGVGGDGGRNFLELKKDTIKVYSNFNGARKNFIGRRI